MLILITVLLSAALLVIIAARTYTYFRHTTEKLILGQQFATITSLAQNIDQSITTAHNALISDAKVLLSKAMDTPKNAQIWLSDRVGITSIFTYGLFLFTPDGKIFAEKPDVGRQGLDLSFREYYKKTVSTETADLSTLYSASFSLIMERCNSPAMLGKAQPSRSFSLFRQVI